MQKIVIVGGGHAAAQLCASLADAKFQGQVTLVSAEARLPYHRPPLSKAFLKDPQAPFQLIRPEASYAAAGVELRLGDAAVKLDRAAGQLHLQSGATVPYDVLVLATGSTARALPGLADPCHGVLSLRTAGDALRVRDALANVESIAVLGGGFIGLELAATARLLGKEVHVIEGAPRLLARAVSPEISDWLLHVHRAAGIDVELSTPVDDLRFDESGRLTGMVRHGEVLPLDLLVLGIGAVPETALAEAAGLEVRNGIVVDDSLRTSDPAIYAIGDCASFPYSGGVHLRLESVQNANDQAKHVAAALASGVATPYAAVPWFWSEQGSVRLQMVGIAPPDAQRFRRPGKTEADFAVLHYVEGRLVAAEMVNSAADYMTVRKLLERGVSIPAESAIDPAVALKSFL